MSSLPPNYLAQQRPYRYVRLLDVAVLLYHIYQGAEDNEVGFEDAHETIDTITRKLNKTVSVDMAVLESALWSCNLLHEKGKFKHPRGLTFDQFVDAVVKPGKFDRKYNLVIVKGSD